MRRLLLLDYRLQCYALARLRLDQPPLPLQIWQRGLLLLDLFVQHLDLGLLLLDGFLLIFQLLILKATQLLEDLIEVELMRQVQIILELVQEELYEGADHGADLVVKLEELLWWVPVLLGLLSLLEEVLEDTLLWVLR